MSELTPRQEKFCQIYVETGNASEAYRNAFNSKAKQTSIWVEASKLLSSPNVTLRVDAIREALRANHGITLRDILGELEEARTLAIDSGQPSAAISATMGKAKLLGFDKPQDQQSSQPISIVIENPHGSN